MKQPGINLFLVFFMLTGFILTTLGQGNVIKLNIFSPIVKTFNIQYEKKLKSDASFQAWIVSPVDYTILYWKKIKKLFLISSILPKLNT